MSIWQRVSSDSARMTAPPLPITSRIFSGLILKVTMRGAYRGTNQERHAFARGAGLANLYPGSQELGMSASAAGAGDAFALVACTFWGEFR